MIVRVNNIVEKAKRAVLPLSPYVSILAQCICKWAEKDFGDYDKKVLFLFIQPFLSQKLMDLAIMT